VHNYKQVYLQWIICIFQNIHMGYIYKVNTYGYKVDWWDWQSGSRNRWCKVYEGFFYTVPEECICCVEVPAVHSQMLSEDMQCITDSDIFISNCLNRHVLHDRMYWVYMTVLCCKFCMLINIICIKIQIIHCKYTCL
jgi:hypothetical protein